MAKALKLGSDKESPGSRRTPTAGRPRAGAQRRVVQRRQAANRWTSVTANLDSPSGIDAAAQQVEGLSVNVTAHEVALAAHERTHLDTFEALYKDQITITSEALSQVEDTDFAAEGCGSLAEVPRLRGVSPRATAWYQAPGRGPNGHGAVGGMASAAFGRAVATLEARWRGVLVSMFAVESDYETFQKAR